MTIYRFSTDVLKNGGSIHFWCATVSSMGLNSCKYNQYFIETFSSEAECQATLQAIKSGQLTSGDPEKDAQGQALAQAATCEQYSPSYELSSDDFYYVYLKHTVSNDIITASYTCIKYTEGGINKEVCLRGGDSSYYGTFDGYHHMTEKMIIILVM